jgi:hypothetical protein
MSEQSEEITNQLDQEPQISEEDTEEVVTQPDLSDMPEEQLPTSEELGIQFSFNYLAELMANLPDFDDMPGMNCALFMSQQGNLLEQFVEGFHQALQTTRTTTFHDMGDMQFFLRDFIQLCDQIVPYMVAYTVVKYHIRQSRPH